MRLAPGKPPEKETIDRTEAQPARLGSFFRPVHVLEQPGDLAGRKVRVEQQSGLAGNFTFVTGTVKRFTKIRGAPILPDNGIVNGFPGVAIPNDRGFTLVGDSNAGDIFRRNVGLRHHGTNR